MATTKIVNHVRKISCLYFTEDSEEIFEGGARKSPAQICFIISPIESLIWQIKRLLQLQSYGISYFLLEWMIEE